MYLGFPLSDELLEKVQTLIVDLRSSENRRPLAMRLFGVISDLSDEGLHHFFIASLAKVGLGKIKLMAVENGLKIGKKAILSVTKRMIKGFNDEQLLMAADLLEEGLTIRPNEV